MDSYSYASLGLVAALLYYGCVSPPENSAAGWMLLLGLSMVGGAMALHRRFYRKGGALFSENPSLPTWKFWIQRAYADLADMSPVFFAWFLVRCFFFDLSFIPSGSMQPSLWEGDCVLVSRIHYGLRLPSKQSRHLFGKEPKRGDVVCFYPPTDTKNLLFVKRIIGMPGDKVHLADGELVVTRPNTEPGQEIPTPITASWKVVDPPHNGVRPISDDVSLVEEILADAPAHCIQFIPSQGGPDADEERRGRDWIIPEDCYFVMGDNRNNSEDSRYFGVVPRSRIVGTPILIVASYQKTPLSYFPEVRWWRWFKRIH